MTLARGLRSVLVPLAILTMLGVALTPLSTGTPGSDGEDSRDFRSYMEPRLIALLESARDVEGMVSERSRNVLALRAESDRIEAITDDIDAYLRQTEPPDWAEPVVTHYRDGAGLILMAIDEAYAALGSFDFSAMPAMIPVFSEGVGELEEALGVLKASMGDGSSYTGKAVAKHGDAASGSGPRAITT